MPPRVRPRPRLALYMFERDLRAPQAAVALGVSEQHVHNITRAFDDPRRKTPSTALMMRIAAWTWGAVGPADFYPPSDHAANGPGSADPAPAPRAGT